MFNIQHSIVTTWYSIVNVQHSIIQQSLVNIQHSSFSGQYSTSYSIPGGHYSLCIKYSTIDIYLIISICKHLICNHHCNLLYVQYLMCKREKREEGGFSFGLVSQNTLVWFGLVWFGLAWSTDGWIETWLGGWIHGWMEGWIDSWLDEYMNRSRWMDGWMDWWTNGITNSPIVR